MKAMTDMGRTGIPMCFHLGWCLGSVESGVLRLIVCFLRHTGAQCMISSHYCIESGTC